MNLRRWAAALSVWFVAFFGVYFGERAQSRATGAPPPSIHTFSTEDIASTGFFYVGGQYVGAPGKEVMDGAEYVEVMVPKKIRHPYAIVLFHGAGQTATDWLQTPDGRAGWAYYFIKQGYTVYMVDYPARGRSPYNPNPDGDGALTIRSGPLLEQVFTDIGAQGNWPQAKKFTQWPGDGPNKGKMGDPIFDDFAKTQVQFLPGGKQAKLNLDAHIALLDRIGSPVIVITYSQGGEFGWQIADARPKPVKAIVTAEPGGPPIKNVKISKTAYGAAGSYAWGVTSLPLHYDPPVSNPAELQPVLEEKADAGLCLFHLWTGLFVSRVTHLLDALPPPLAVLPNRSFPLITSRARQRFDFRAVLHHLFQRNQSFLAERRQYLREQLVQFFLSVHVKIRFSSSTACQLLCCRFP